MEIGSFEPKEQLVAKNGNPVTNDRSHDQTITEQILEKLRGLIRIRKIEDNNLSVRSDEGKDVLKNQMFINLISGKTMLMAGLYEEALTDLARAREIFRSIYDLDERNSEVLVSKLDRIIDQVKELNK